MHTISSYHGNRSPPHTHTNPQTGLITTHCAGAKLSAQCNHMLKEFQLAHYSHSSKLTMFPGVVWDIFTGSNATMIQSTESTGK